MHPYWYYLHRDFRKIAGESGDHATFVLRQGFVKMPMAQFMKRSRRWRSGTVLVFVALAFFSALTFPASRSLAPAERKEVFEKVWKEIDEHYYDPAFGGVNWNDVHDRYLPLVQAAKDDQDFYSILDRLTAELHDAHTRFSSPEQWENRKKHQRVSTGFRPGYVEGKVVVLDVYLESNAQRAGVQPGMIVTAVDGQPMDALLAKAAKTVLESSTERVTQLRVLSNVFGGTLETPFLGKFQRADGSEFEAKYPRQVISNAPHVTAALLPSGFGYIRFDEFQHSVVGDFKVALEHFHAAPGLILDMRWNGGGDGATLQAVSELFFNKKTLFEVRQSRKQVSAGERDGQHTEETKVYVGKKSEKIYSGPVVILQSVYSASATEVFGAGMQDSGRATVVGGQSCGCVLGITHDRVMKGGGVLEVSEILWFSPKGRKLEGEGVIPDKAVEPTIASLQQHKDLLLEEGEMTLRAAIAAQAEAAPH
jgi:carboxyl-terminal processing protease